MVRKVRKLRFELEMKDGAAIGSLEDLAEHFDLEKVLSYVENGKLATWLKDRYYEDMAEEVEKIDSKEADAGEKVCKILELPIAFHQEDLYNLLDESCEKIYLYGEKFEIPLSKGHVTYIGLTKPVVKIRSKQIVDWKKKQITIQNCVFDSKYLALTSKEQQKQECKDFYDKILKESPYKDYRPFEELYELALSIVNRQQNG